MTQQPRNFYDALAEWLDVRDALKPLQEREKELRLQLFAAAFPEPREGANNYPLPTGQKFVGTHKTTRSVEEKKIGEVDQLLQASGSNYRVGHFLKPSYSLKATEYKQAPANVRAILDRMITTKPAMPVIEVKDDA